MKLFGHPHSGHAFKVKFFLNYANIEHDYSMIDIFSPRESRPLEFRKYARYHEVPLLVDEGEAYVQSGAILIYLANKFQKFGGESHTQMQRNIEWIVWESNKIGMCVPQLRADKMYADSKLEEGARAWLMKRYQHDIGLLNDTLNDGRDFITGDKPTIADFSLSGYLFYAEDAALLLPKNVEAWLHRLSQLNGWGKPQELLE